MNDIKNIGVLGSTGSIGTQTLDIIEEYPGMFRASVLTARRQWRLLAEQALKFHPDLVVIGDEEFYEPLREALAGSGVEVATGANAIAEAAAYPKNDIVVTAMVGYSGLLPTISAIKARKTIALSNKETLVVAGELITGLCRENNVDIVPVDSEHSAIFQCLVGEKRDEMRKIILTASGGPFRKLSKDQLKEVTPADALKHPNWDMGAKVTIDSASMMNKGFEMIEARWLFDCPPENIEVVVHPQSIVHSMVEYRDGSVKAQLGVPDMHTPIRYALSYPSRLHTESRPMRLEDYSTLTFERPDLEKFPLLGYAFEAIAKGGTMPCILNAANEIAVQAFLENKIRFTDMPEVALKTMELTEWSDTPDLDTLVATNREARKIAESMIVKFQKR
ncbi:MAG: 1-deoxy-D-xylulose-5-phosphate reductoisomerase [Muribaculaceae bacterium]|nr:1-deoxy-D-xylulose-5-phosphate reductoisomerase [Muribaculaceae bacterium]